MDDSVESGTNEAEAYAEKGRVLGFLDELIDVFTPSPPKKEVQRKRKDDDDDRRVDFKASLPRSKSTCEIINGALTMPTPRAVFDGVRVNIEKNGKVLDADRFEELEDGDLFFDYIAWLVAMLSITLWLHGDKLWSFATFWWVLPGCVPSAIMLPYGLDPRGDLTAMLYRACLIAFGGWWMKLPTAVLVPLVPVAAMVGQRICTITSTSLAEHLMRERRDAKCGAWPPQWHV